MHPLLLLLVLICFPRTISSTPTELSFTPPFTATASITKTTFFIHDNMHNKFVLKYHPRGPQRAICDTLGAYIGKSISININDVEIFSAHHPFNTFFNEINPLVPSQIGVTTLHLRVPGIPVKSIKKMNDTICIKRGLCKEKHLRSITRYKQLRDIVAFDLFTDNFDRHNGNLLFDKKTKQFYAIDMDHSLKSSSMLVATPHEYDFKTVATCAYYFLKTLKKRRLSLKEIKALKRIKHTLQILAVNNPPATLYREWMAIAEKADYIYSQREKEKIRKYLEYNAEQVDRLLLQLNEII